ncbi:hypothetical protein J437_LFUL017064 [Ladona fulva]|uniref:Uncharacterized protein n=1 Tax=Ladona fulva TaxID=123851 RepID=A0A8K0PB98_LADFU|nr:hypothetical protein J437_LFUL017064 [Ladona fulva]
MENCKGVSTPMELKLKLKDLGEGKDINVPYQKLIEGCDSKPKASRSEYWSFSVSIELNLFEDAAFESDAVKGTGVTIIKSPSSDLPIKVE